MLNEEGFLQPHLSESGCSALPADQTNRSQMATTLPSGLEYTGSVSSRLADPRSVTFTPQAIDSSVLVFDSSMRAMAQRQRNRKSQAAKDAARHLRRTGGACSRHKASKKKVSELTQGHWLALMPFHSVVAAQRPVPRRTLSPPELFQTHRFSRKSLRRPKSLLPSTISRT